MIISRFFLTIFILDTFIFFFLLYLDLDFKLSYLCLVCLFFLYWLCLYWKILATSLYLICLLSCINCTNIWDFSYYFYILFVHFVYVCICYTFLSIVFQYTNFKKPKKKTFSKNFASTFIFLFLFIKYLAFFFFMFSYIGKKGWFYKILSINY